MKNFLNRIAAMTNATKANIISAVNAILGLLIAFNVAFSQAQLGAIDVAVNAILAVIVGLTFTQSSMRLKHPR